MDGTLGSNLSCLASRGVFGSASADGLLNFNNLDIEADTGVKYFELSVDGVKKEALKLLTRAENAFHAAA